ncbi:MAG TPA: NAD(P)/FAD-dependent oxidoreductase [Chloroflexota bacterium]|nr:NAD(P)/FAD-dependent oxidoreductase [Chloroflexota bacterium]
MQRVEVVVVGAGHAGLSTSYFLSRAGIEHLVLERGLVGEKWRGCWDSFYLNTANGAFNLPGAAYAGDEPDAFLSRDETVRCLEEYAVSFQAPVRTRTRVVAVTHSADRYVVETDQGSVEARAVVVASGYFARPRIPSSAADLAPDIVQVHSSAYRNPDGLPPGAVLVVGGAQSGPQIAEDLLEAGRDVYLATSRTGRTPRRYRGKDGFWWMLQAGIYDHPVDQLPDPNFRWAPGRLLSGTRGGHTINLHEFARIGIRLLGHYESGDGYRLAFAPNLHWTLAESDALTARLTRQLDEYIEQAGLSVPPRNPDNTDDYDGDDGFRLPEVTELDMRSAGISSIVWGTGYHVDYSFVRVPVFDRTGQPIHRRGVTAFPGLYFMGIHFQHTGRSDLFCGVGDDAAFIAAAIEHQLATASDKS